MRKDEIERVTKDLQDTKRRSKTEMAEMLSVRCCGWLVGWFCEISVDCGFFFTPLMLHIGTILSLRCLFFVDKIRFHQLNLHIISCSVPSDDVSANGDTVVHSSLARGFRSFLRLESLFFHITSVATISNENLSQHTVGGRYFEQRHREQLLKEIRSLKTKKQRDNRAESFWVVATQIFFYVHPYLGKIPILTHIFQRG